MASNNSLGILPKKDKKAKQERKKNVARFVFIILAAQASSSLYIRFMILFWIQPKKLLVEFESISN